MKRRLAQFDLVKPSFPRGHVKMKDFYNSTAYVNALAEHLSKEFGLTESFFVDHPTGL